MKNKKQRGYNLQLDSPIGNFAKGKMSAPEFDFMGRGAAWWLWKAEELHRMATLGVQAHYADCEERRPFFAKRDFTGYVLKPSTLKVAFFLAVLAIENLLKGSLVKEHPEYIKDGKFRGEIISSHNLIKIARDANIS